MAMSRDQLAAAPNGATEAIMLAHGFKADLLAGHRHWVGHESVSELRRLTLK
jgi:hypothetical protein